MGMLRTKHFQYTGVDDFDKSIDMQINDYMKEYSIDEDKLIDIKYSAHSSQGVNTYSALILYIEE